MRDFTIAQWGDNSVASKVAQRLITLNMEEDEYGLKDDGIFGAKTYNAAVRFQKRPGRTPPLRPDGAVGPKTFQALGLTTICTHNVRMHAQRRPGSCWAAAAAMLLGGREPGHGPAQPDRNGRLVPTDPNVQLFAKGLGWDYLPGREPYVLVGHSLGGMLARVYAGYYPSEVSGMVLVDSAHEDEPDRAVALTPPDLLKEMLKQARPEDLTPRSAERIDGCSVRTLMNALDWRADIPLVVLTQGIPYGPDMVAVPSLAPKAYQLHLELQRELATRSPRGRHLIAEKSGHSIHQDQPDLVVNAIREVLEASKKRKAQ
jgi:hypothetical protein